MALGSNTKEPLLSIITTAGKDLTYPCYTQEYDYCSKLLDPSVDVHNDEYFVDICEADPGDDIGSEDTWKKANPIRDVLRKAYRKSKGIMRLLSRFRKNDSIFDESTEYVGAGQG